MLTDVAIKALKSKEKDYKVADRDGMYVHVTTKGALSFRMDYRLNGRRETIYLGKYGPDGLSLARAREKCIDARRAIADGISPAIEKQREKRRLKESKSFGEFGEKWLTAAPMADSTRAMRRSIFERELLPVWRNRLLTEISPDDLRAHCASIVDRGAPATAIHVRDILKQIYGFAILHGEKVANPAEEVGQPMKAPDRSHVASSFTLIKGAMIDETYAVFAAWDFGASKKENLDRLKRENFIGASSATWLRDIAKVLNRRLRSSH